MDVEQRENGWKTKLSIFKVLYRQAKHRGWKLVQIANGQFYVKRVLSFSSKKLHQVADTLSNTSIYDFANHLSEC